METEATYTSTSESQVCPEDIKKRRGLGTGLAYNNFDRFVDTNSGEDTLHLHDTVGIIFQNIDPDESSGEELSNTFQADNENDVNVSACLATQTSRKRRRTFSAISPELPSYFKKLKLCETLLPVNADTRFSVSDNLKSVQRLYLAWMVSHFFKNH